MPCGSHNPEIGAEGISGEEALGTQAGVIREDGMPGERSEGRQGSLSGDGKAVGSSAGKGMHREG